MRDFLFEKNFSLYEKWARYIVECRIDAQSDLISSDMRILLSPDNERRSFTAKIWHLTNKLIQWLDSMIRFKGVIFLPPRILVCGKTIIKQFPFGGEYGDWGL